MEYSKIAISHHAQIPCVPPLGYSLYQEYVWAVLMQDVYMKNIIVVRELIM